MKRKRNESPVYGWLWTVFTVVLIIVGIFLANERGFTWDGFALWCLLLVIPGLGTVCTVYHEQHEQTLEFIVYEFELWQKEEMKYEPRYIVDMKTLRSVFVYGWHVKDYESFMTLDQVENYLNRDEHIFGYKSETEVMQYITDIVQGFITNKKERENVKVRNIRMSATHTVEDITDKINRGELKAKKK